MQIGNISYIIGVGILIIFIDLILGSVVYLNNRKSSTNKIFALFNIVAGLWLSFNLLGTFVVDPSAKLFWIKMVMLSAVLLTGLFYLFIKVFPKDTLIINTSEKIFIAGLIILNSLLALSPFVFSGIKDIDVYGIPTPEIQNGIFIFGITVFYLIFYSLYQLLTKYRNSKGIEKNQLSYLLVGAATMFILLLIFNFIFVALLKITTFINFSSIFISIFIIFSAYAIIKYGLFNIKIIATELIVFTLWIFLLIRTVISNNTSDIVINGILLIITLFVGTLLIKSVIKEVEQREKLEVLTKELEAANVKLKELDRLKSEFLSFASHQVKTPMTAVKGYASLIFDGTYGVVSEKIQDVARKISDAADRMVALVNNLLDLRKIEEGKMDYKFEEMNLPALIDNVTVELRTLAVKKNLELTFKSSTKDIKIKADSEKLRQVIQNLIDNAIKYTNAGFIKVEAKKENNQVLISVKDAGMGISKELIPRLFDQFSRDKNAAKTIAGTGLGLYIAKQIITAHDGKIWAESEGEGKGSQFYVQLSI